MEVFFIGRVLKIIIIVLLILRKNQLQQNYCSRSLTDFCSFSYPPFCFVADGREGDWKLMAGTNVFNHTGIILSIYSEKRELLSIIPK